MKATYGTYDHDGQDVLIQSMRDRGVRRGGVIVSVQRSIRVQWEIRGASQDELTQKMLLAELAYHNHGQDFLLYQDNGNVSAHGLILSGATVNTDITEFGYVTGTGVEYATKRTCYAVIEGAIEYEDNGGGAGGTNLYNYRDSLTFTGNGGPRFVMKELPNGNPVKHTLNAVTTQRMVQSGSASHRQFFVFPQLVGPADELLNPDVSQTKTGPYYVRGQAVYETSWNYQWAGGTGYSNLNPTIGI